MSSLKKEPRTVDVPVFPISNLNHIIEFPFVEYGFSQASINMVRQICMYSSFQDRMWCTGLDSTTADKLKYW